MSHVALVKTEFKDIDALKEAAALCGLEYRENQKTFNWYGAWMKDYSKEDAAYRNGIPAESYGICDSAIRIPGDYPSYSDTRGRSLPYEIGVYKQADGSVKLAWDFFQGGHGLQDAIGRDGEKLTHAYSKTVAKKEANKTVRRLERKFAGTRWRTEEVGYDEHGNYVHDIVQYA